MEQETGLIRQDVLAVAIQEARQEKMKKLELKKLEKLEKITMLKLAEQEFRLKEKPRQDILINTLSIGYLKAEFDMTKDQVEKVLNDIPSRIKLWQTLVKYLEKEMRLTHMLKIARTVAPILSTLLVYFSFLLSKTSWELMGLIFLFLAFPGFISAVLMYVFAYDKEENIFFISRSSCEIRDIEGRKHNLKKVVSGIIKRLEERITDTKTNQKLIEQS